MTDEPANTTSMTRRIALILALLLVIAASAASVIWSELYSKKSNSLPKAAPYVPVLPGDPQAGKKLYFDAKFACAQCHRRGDRGGSIGPDLSAIAARMDRYALERAILVLLGEPHSFVNAIIVEKSGAVQTGIIELGPADPVQLIKPDGNVVAIPRSQIDELRESTAPHMPTNYPDLLTARQLADLCAILPASRERSFTMASRERQRPVSRERDGR